MISKKKLKTVYKGVLILLVTVLILSVVLNFTLYNNNKKILKYIEEVKDSDEVTYESIIEALNNSCNNFEVKNSTILSLASALSFSEDYVDSQAKLLYLYCDILKEKNKCNKISKNYNLADNTFLTVLLVIKKYVNSEITEDKFNSIICNLTFYLKNEDIDSMKKLRENIQLK